MKKIAAVVVALACTSVIASNTDPHSTGKSKPGRDRAPATKPATQPAAE